ncbi:hypothetical protein JCM14076_15910 [Methylosoma difficile]
MERIFIWLLTVFMSVPGRVLATMGFGWVSYHGYKTAIDEVVSQATSSVNSISGVAYELAGLFGFIDAFGIILGAISGKSVLATVDKLTKILNH